MSEVPLYHTVAAQSRLWIFCRMAVACNQVRRLERATCGDFPIAKRERLQPGGGFGRPPIERVARDAPAVLQHSALMMYYRIPLPDIEQWLQRHPEVGSSWPSWPEASHRLGGGFGSRHSPTEGP